MTHQILVQNGTDDESGLGLTGLIRLGLCCSDWVGCHVGTEVTFEPLLPCSSLRLEDT